jgi:hypothetical protein
MPHALQLMADAVERADRECIEREVRRVEGDVPTRLFEMWREIAIGRPVR